MHSFGVFLYRRGLDQIAMSIAAPNLPVRLMAFCHGYNSKDGITHQGIDDLAVLRAMPNMTVLDLGDATEVEGFLSAADMVDGPIWVRMLRYDVPRLFDPAEPFTIGQCRQLRHGTDMLILSAGETTGDAITTANALTGDGISVEHLHVSTINPFVDPTVLDTLAASFPFVVTIENHVRTGGLGSAVAETLADIGTPSKLLRLGLPDRFLRGGPPSALKTSVGLDTHSLTTAIRSHLPKARRFR